MIYIDGNHDLKSVNRIDRITKGWPFVFHKNFMSCVNPVSYTHLFINTSVSEVNYSID